MWARVIICENEQVHIWNINYGERFITYTVKGESGSGMISVNGSAARRASVGDLLVIAAFAQVHEKDVATYEPQLVFVDGHNRQWACATMCPRSFRRGTARTSAD